MNHENAIAQESNSESMKILLMMYDGTIDYLNRAVDYAEQGDMKNKNIYANKAGDVIAELNNALNLSEGGEIAEQLRHLYVLMGRFLIEAIDKNKSQGLNEVLKMMANMKKGWEDVYGTVCAGEEKSMSAVL